MVDPDPVELAGDPCEDEAAAAAAAVEAAATVGRDPLLAPISGSETEFDLEATLIGVDVADDVSPAISKFRSYTDSTKINRLGHNIRMY